MNQIKFLFVLNEKYKQGGRQYKFIFLFKYPAFKCSYFEKPLKTGEVSLKNRNLQKSGLFKKKHFIENIY